MNQNFPGIDRVNNNIGYVLNNCVSCCKFCNSAKLDRTLIEFRDWIKKVYNQQFTNNFL